MQQWHDFTKILTGIYYFAYQGTVRAKHTHIIFDAIFSAFVDL